ncbi:hypothetical protein ACLINR_000425 [Vibrio parahaemolyticus]
MLKNWTVITKPVRDGSNGIIAREKYLNSANHPNHANTEAIFDIVGNEITSKRILISGEQYRLQQKLRSERRGRPLSSYAMEFCLTLPKTYRPSREQWKAIIADCCKALAIHLDLTGDDRKKFYSLVRGVCHQQGEHSSYRGTGDHVHLIVSKLVNGQVLTGLQKKGATTTLKAAFTLSVTKYLGISVDSYTPQKLERGQRLEKWQYESQQLQAANEQHKNLLNKLERQISKWEDAVATADMRQIRRQRNRIEKSLAQAEAFGLKLDDVKGKLQN